MDLKKFLPNLDEKEKVEHYWALVIEPGWVQAGIWRILNQKAQVLYTSKDSAWELDSELIESCDKALSSAIEDFPEGYVEPSKTVFGVSYNWVNGGEIKPEFLDKIKKVCKELSLTPVGFVVLPEAISHLVKSDEGTPLNAIILGAYKESVELSLFQLGKLVGTTQIVRSSNLTEDVVEGINRLSQGDTLPSRFLIYDGKEADLEEVRQILINSNWEDFPNTKFLHTPKVELIDTKKKIYSVALAGASEIANVTSLETPAEKETATEMVNEAPEMTQKTYVAEEEKEVSPEEMGFLLDKDVREEMSSTGPLDEESNVREVDHQEIESYGVDIKTHTDDLLGNERTQVNQQINFHQKPTRTQSPKKAGLSLAAVMAPISKLLAQVRNIKVPGPGKIAPFSPKNTLPRMSPRGLNRTMIIGGILLILLLVGGFAAWWFLPKATVVVYVSPKKLVEETEVTVSVKGSSDISQKKVSGRLVEAELSGERTKDTTGKKTVGDKAKGEVTIYRVGPELSLAAGTALNGPDRLKFILDSSITIASGSGITSPGVTKAPVVAQDIGSQYNLGAGATFTLGNYSTGDMEAKNETAFTGGSSKEVSSVSKEDQTSLENDLLTELGEQAGSDLAEKVDLKDYFVKDSQKVEKTDADFDQKIGDEAQTLKLLLSVKASALVVSKEDLTKIAEEVLKDKVPDGFVLRGEQLTYSFEDEREVDGEYRFNLKISANLLPNLKTDEIGKKIAGRYPKLAQDYLRREAPGFVKAEVDIFPNLPGRLKTLPHVAKNIDVQISAEK